MRRAISKALPGAEETISYKIPAYKLHGGIVLYFAGWKQHHSFYPADERLLAAFKTELGRYQVSKNTIRFRLSERAPVNLIKRIAKFRATEAAERDKAKSAASE